MRATFARRSLPVSTSAVAIIVVVFVAHVSAPATLAGGDTLWSVQLGYSLLHEHDVDLNEYADLARVTPVHTTVLASGRRVFDFPWGTSFVSVPFIGVLDLWMYLQHDSLRASLHRRFPASIVEKQVASMEVAISSALLFLLLVRRTKRSALAAVVTACFAFATSMFSTVSRALWMHAPSVLLLLGALLLFQIVEDHPEWRQGRSPRAGAAVLAIGFALGVGYVVRPTNAVPLAVILLALTLRRWRWGLTALVGAVIPFLWLVWIDMRTWGVPLAPYYTSGQRLGMSHSFLAGLAGNLVSPARGLFVWSPFVVIALPAALSALRSPRRDVVLSVCVATTFLHWIAISTPRPWFAGASVGPRFFSDALPFLMVLVTEGLLTLGTLSLSARSVAATGFGVLVAWSLFVNVRAATHFSVQEWNFTPPGVSERRTPQGPDPARIWDWRDPQFLR